jgi:hypothetical protein
VVLRVREDSTLPPLILHPGANTPKHGSWLNIAEIELSVLTQQCLGRRIPDIETLQQETHAWANRRNAQQKGVDWQFTTEDARIKLKRLYPQVQS